MRTRHLTVMALATSVVAGGCATPTQINLGVPFDPALAQQQLAEGTNGVRGSAFLRQKGGGVVTCAGSEVSLVPATAYAQRLYAALYGNTGGPALRSAGQVDIQPKAPDFGTHMHRARCDAQGNFAFERVADGDWYVETTVTWMVGYAMQGGAMMSRVRLEGGRTAQVVISP